MSFEYKDLETLAAERMPALLGDVDNGIEVFDELHDTVLADLELDDLSVTMLVDVASAIGAMEMDNPEVIEAGRRAYTFAHLVSSLVAPISRGLPVVDAERAGGDITRLHRLFEKVACGYLLPSPIIRGLTESNLSTLDPTGRYPNVVKLVAGITLSDIEKQLYDSARQDYETGVFEDMARHYDTTAE